MNISELKTYIYENKYVEQILESIGCHHIKYHASNGYWTCANATGDNNTAIVLYNEEPLFCTNYTRQMIETKRATDIIDLVGYTKDLNFVQSIKYICGEIGMDYYHDFDEDVPMSFQILKMLQEMDTSYDEERDKPLIPINECILGYYKPYVNDLFAEDNINYETQRLFEVGYDEETCRYTIPIRSELGDLVGVKGRYFYRDVPDGYNKYVYIEPCSKSKILYGLHTTMQYIQEKGRVYVVESEKAVMQLYSYGYKNCVGTGGKTLSQHQIEMLVRLGVKICFCFDKDVTKEEMESLANKFPDGITLYYMFDEDGLLSGHESPSDNPNKWDTLVKNNIYKLR